MAVPSPAPDVPVVSFADQEAWRTWLEQHHGDAAAGVWLQIARKHSAAARALTYAEALDVALCYGWIDGQKRGLDEGAWLQRFTPRRSRSIWSKANRAKAESLIAAGAMRPAGLAEVERAKADGRWQAAYDGQRTAAVPDDLAAALAAEPAAEEFFATLTGQNRYAILHRLMTAKRPETRARRLATFVEMLAKGDTLYP
ncbi:MAG: YdeI/OmpD-associated family protein [Actinomycetes bacterium]